MSRPRLALVASALVLLSGCSAGSDGDGSTASAVPPAPQQLSEELRSSLGGDASRLLQLARSESESRSEPVALDAANAQSTRSAGVQVVRDGAVDPVDSVPFELEAELEGDGFALLYAWWRDGSGCASVTFTGGPSNAQPAAELWIGEPGGELQEGACDSFLVPGSAAPPAASSS